MISAIQQSLAFFFLFTKIMILDVNFHLYLLYVIILSIYASKRFSLLNLNDTVMWLLVFTTNLVYKIIRN